MTALPFLVGTLLALVVGLIGRVFGLDRDRAFYPTALIVIGSYYSLFAVMGGSTHAIVVETIVACAFAAAALAGFRASLWIVVIAMAGHGVFDFGHGSVITNPGVPRWWPAFCGAYDVIAAGFLGWLLATRRVDANSLRNESLP